MTSIEKILIQGIRSFDPKESSVVDFYTPLTLIVGQNGAGKTTIIECLKYSCTGEMPPNCSSGQAFIHDTKIAGESEVKAQIKLRFKNPIGKPIVASRSLSLTQKAKNKQEYKQIDASLQSYTSEGQKVSKSFRCSDLDKEIPDLMGVAKPILKHVIFCHQEESNWPLSESSKLKLKFDEIFSAVKYTKALKSLKDKRKEITTTVKELKLQLETVGAHMENVNRIKNDLSKMQDQFSSGSKNLENINIEILEKQKLLSTIKGAEVKLRELKNDISVLNARKLEMEKVKNQLFNSLSEVFQESSDEELVFMQTTFNDELEIMLNAEKELSDNLERLNSEKEFINQQLKEKNQNLYKFKSQIDQQTLIINDRDKQMDEFINRYKMNEFLSLVKPYSIQDVDKFISQIQSKYEMLTLTINTTTKNYKQSISVTNSKLNDSRVKLEQELSSSQLKQQQISSNLIKIQQIDKDINERNQSVNQIESLENEIQILDNELNQLKSDTNILLIEQNLESLNSQRLNLESTISKFKNSLKLLNLQLSSRTRLNIKRNEVKQKSSQIQLKFNDNLNSILNLLNQDINNSSNGEELFKNYLNNKLNLINLIQNEMKSINLKESLNEIQINSNSLNQVNYQLENQIENELSTKQQQFKDNEIKINQFIEFFNQLGSDNSIQDLFNGDEIKFKLLNLEVSNCSKEIHSILRLFKTLLEDKEKQFILLESENVLYKEYIEKANDNQECSLCKTEMRDSNKLSSFVNKLESHIHDIPSQIEKLSIQIKEIKSIYSRLEESLPFINEYSSLLNEIPILEKQKSSLLLEKQQLLETIKQLKSNYQSSETKLNQLNQLNQAIESLESIKQVISTIEIEINNEENEIKRQSSDLRTIEEVEEDLALKDKELQVVNDSIKLKLQQQKDQQSIIFEKNSKIIELKNNLQQIKSSSSAIDHLRDNKKELIQVTQQLQLEIDQFNANKESLENEIKKFEIDYQKQESEFEKRIETFSKEKNVFSYRLDSIKQLQVKVLSLTNHQDININQLQEEINQLEEKIKIINEDYATGQLHIQTIQQQLSGKDSTKRAISDNITYRQQLLNLEQITNQIIRKSELVKEMHQSQLEIDSSKVEQDLHSLKSRFDQITGSISVLESQINNCHRELSKQVYKQIDEQHKNLLIQLHTIDTVGKDLDKYYKALDKALMKFHNLKMDEINRSIKEIWQTTYKGSDIDTIEIRSEESGAANKTIHYRVVMIKGEVELDMRGRCSAGQKVLACLVIRLALAENFCSNCGILALDEPTSHLDRANIESFANSLLNIIESRKTQKGFQLIIITHDEEFVQYLSRGNYCDYYWRVTKNSNGYSNLERKEIAEI